MVINTSFSPLKHTAPSAEELPNVPQNSFLDFHFVISLEGEGSKKVLSLPRRDETNGVFEMNVSMHVSHILVQKSVKAPFFDSAESVKLHKAGTFLASDLSWNS